MRKDISAFRRNYELRFWQDLCSWTHFRFFWKSDVDFLHFGLFCFDFQSHRSQILEGVERAVWLCMEIFASILIFFRKILCGIVVFWSFLVLLARSGSNLQVGVIWNCLNKSTYQFSKLELHRTGQNNKKDQNTRIPHQTFRKKKTKMEAKISMHNQTRSTPSKLWERCDWKSN